MKSINLYVPSGRIFHTTACLAQGFDELGFTINSNLNFSIENIDSRGISTPYSNQPNTVIKPINFESTEPFLIDVTHGLGDIDTVQRLLGKKEVVLINMSDGVNFQDYPDGLKILTAHTNTFCRRRGRIFPMGFGLSSDIINIAKSKNISNTREVKVLQNFKPSLSQGVRNFMALTIEQKLNKMNLLNVSSIEHSVYPEIIARTKFICSYGGEIYRDLNKADNFGDNSFAENVTYRFKNISKEYIILRWDSWRFYEAAIFGCLPLNLDFEEYGFQLPFQPSKDMYIPISLSDIDKAIMSIVDLGSNNVKYNEVSFSLREWAENHYSPIAMARYVLSIFDDDY